MDRRTLICAFDAAAIGRPLAAYAQGEAKARIGWLAVGPIPSNMAAFRQTLKQRGYLEGQNVVLEERYASTAERLPNLIAELIRLKVDVIVTTGG